MKKRNKIIFYNYKDYAEYSGGQGIPTHIGFMILLVVGLIVSWMIVSMGEDVANRIPTQEITAYNQSLLKALRNTK